MKNKYISVLSLCLTSALLLTGCGGKASMGNNFTTVEFADSFCVDSAIQAELPEQDFNTEEYTFIEENGFVRVSVNPLSTFAADVDTGSYCNLRRLIKSGSNLDNIQKAIRTEEMINYFDYDMPESDNIFSIKSELNTCPWNPENDLLIMTLQANAETNIPSNGNNFVFLIDVSGSMDETDKIEMAIKSFKMLAESLNENDRISIVTYSGTADTLLEGSNDYKKICKALDKAQKYCEHYGAGTNGSGGITAAYECAEKNFIENGNNRVIIASDGDMNLGITSNGGLVDLIKEQKESGVFLTVLGFGTGNYSDTNMESIADAGNGNYYYIDNINEAKRVLIDKLKQTTITVAKDVKFQAEFNPAVVDSYRQIGYENRQMSASDFSDDTKDGGEVGAGQQVTVAYEIKYKDSSTTGEQLKYQDQSLTQEALSGDILTLSIRYKDPDKDSSTLLTYSINPDNTCITSDFDFIASIIETSMVIRESEYIGNATLNSAYTLAIYSENNDEYREEFAYLLKELGAKKDENTHQSEYHANKKENIVISIED